MVSFATVQSAINCHDTLSNAVHPEISNLDRHIRFAYSREKEGLSTEWRIPALSWSSEISVPGLVLIPDFVSEALEAVLIQTFDENPWTDLLGRRVQHYIRSFDYRTRYASVVADGLPMFPGLQDVLDMIANDHSYQRPWDVADQVTVNDYEPGHGIPPHVDTVDAFEDCIISISLRSPIIMEFEKQGEPDQRKLVDLPARSLVAFCGDSRYAWTHGIRYRMNDRLDDTTFRTRQRRISITVRRIREGAPGSATACTNL
eukprot:ANDGO_03949.mRNA.1 Uncharacterized protein L905